MMAVGKMAVGFLVSFSEYPKLAFAVSSHPLIFFTVIGK
jgi:hypothetical protein